MRAVDAAVIAFSGITLRRYLSSILTTKLVHLSIKRNSNCPKNRNVRNVRTFRTMNIFRTIAISLHICIYPIRDISRLASLVPKSREAREGRRWTISSPLRVAREVGRAIFELPPTPAACCANSINVSSGTHVTFFRDVLPS